MNFLLTNDDGWDAPGLAALQSVAAKYGQVWTVAPLHPMSGISHQMTFERPMTFVEKSPQTFALDGTPADCVRIATTQLGVSFDWVLSGINNGGNLGMDIFVSGTVAAAREATIRGIRSVALSQHRHRFKLPYDWTFSAWMAEKVLDQVMADEGHWQPYSLVNVNFPDFYHAAKNLSERLLDRNANPSSTKGGRRSFLGAGTAKGEPSVEEGGLPLHSAISIIDPPTIQREQFLQHVEIVRCPVDRHPVPSDFRLDEEERFLYCSKYNERARAVGCDIETCFSGSISISRISLV